MNCSYALCMLKADYSSIYKSFGFVFNNPPLWNHHIAGIFDWNYFKHLFGIMVSILTCNLEGITPSTILYCIASNVLTSANCNMVLKSQLSNSATLNSYTNPARCSQMLPDWLSAERCAPRCSETTLPVPVTALEVVQPNTRISWRMDYCYWNATKSNY